MIGIVSFSFCNCQWRFGRVHRYEKAKPFYRSESNPSDNSFAIAHFGTFLFTFEQFILFATGAK